MRPVILFENVIEIRWDLVVDDQHDSLIALASFARSIVLNVRKKCVLFLSFFWIRACSGRVKENSCQRSPSEFDCTYMYTFFCLLSIPGDLGHNDAHFGFGNVHVYYGTQFSTTLETRCGCWKRLVDILTKNVNEILRFFLKNLEKFGYELRKVWWKLFTNYEKTLQQFQNHFTDFLLVNGKSSRNLEEIFSKLDENFMKKL